MDDIVLRKIRNIQMKYPAPYAQSWNHLEPQTNTNVMKKSSIKEKKNAYSMPQSLSWSNPASKSQPGKKRMSFYEVISQIDKRHKFTLNEKRSETDRLLQSEQKKKEEKAPQSQDTPLFVIRCLEKDTRELSFSDIMHLDIKPNVPLPKQKHLPIASWNQAPRFYRK